VPAKGLINSLSLWERVRVGEFSSINDTYKKKVKYQED
jgi:hypothetical protein